MPIAEMKVSVNSQAAVNATKQLEDQYVKTFNSMQQGMNKMSSAVEKNGTSWTELNSKLSLMKSGLQSVTGIFEKFTAISRERGVLFSQFGDEVELSGLQLMKYSAAVDHMINSNALMRSANALVRGDLQLSEQQFESITKAAVQFARQSGENVNDVLKRITDSITAGTTRGLKPFGIILDETGTKAEKTARMVEELDKRFKDVKISAGDAAEDLDKYNNEMKQLLLLGGEKTEDLTRKWYKLKDSITQGMLTWIEMDRESVRSVQIDKVVDRINKGMDESASLTVVWAKAIGGTNKEILDGYEATKKQVKVLQDNIKRQEALNKIAEKTDDAYGYSLIKIYRMNKALKQVLDMQSKLAEKAGKTAELMFPFAGAAGSAIGGWSDLMEQQEKYKKNAKKLSEEELLNIKLKQIELGKNITLTLKELFLINKIDAKNNIYMEHQKAIEFGNKLTQMQLKREHESYKENAINYQVHGEYLTKKNRLEKLYNDELEKGNKADIFKLSNLNYQIGLLKNATDWQRKLGKHIEEQGNTDYTYLIQSEQKTLELKQLQAQRDLAIKQGKEDVALAAQKNIDLIYAEAKANADTNLVLQQKFEKLNNIKSIYGGLSQDQSLALEMQKEELRLASIKNTGTREEINLSVEKITKMKEQAELSGQLALKMKVWENSSYGAFQATKTMWQASGDALLMTDEQLKKSGKTRGQLMAEALRQSVAQIGKDNWFKGGTKFAEGLGASANPVTAPLAPGYFKAAAAHFGVAAAAGFASRALAGGTSGGSGDKGAAKEAPKTELKTTSNRNVTINIQAGMIVNRDDMVRAVDSAQIDYRRRWG